MFSNKRTLKYCLAINEALHQKMTADPDVFLIGQGVKSPWYVGMTADGLLDRFGASRVIDTPVSENAITGAAVGAAITGMKSIVVHPRMDFMMYALDPIINEAANWYYMNGGRSNVPCVIWGIINRGGEQAAQHSQALHTLFGHIPGLKVVMPATAYDAKGLMVAAIEDPNPVVYIDDRWLHEDECEVPESLYRVQIGSAVVCKSGTDITLVAVSHMVKLALAAATQLASKDGINVEVVDLRTIKPIDYETICESVSKTGHLAVADPGWRSYGMAAEIIAQIHELAFGALKTPAIRITLPDSPAPASRTLEAAYFPTSETLVAAIQKQLCYELGVSVIRERESVSGGSMFAFGDGDNKRVYGTDCGCDKGNV
jgi:pyruvate dehydrogenase E1 component beta subunit